MKAKDLIVGRRYAFTTKISVSSPRRVTSYGIFVGFGGGYNRPADGFLFNTGNRFDPVFVPKARHIVAEAPPGK